MIGNIFFALSSCTVCVYYLEHIQRMDSGAMNLMTFLQFLFISAEGLLMTSRFFTITRHIPLLTYGKIVVIFWTVSLVNNQALNYHVPLPLHIIFKSGSLLTNLLLSMFMLGRRYPLQKYVSVVLVTVGIIVCTLATQKPATDSATASYGWEFVIGLSMLFFALCFSSLLGIFQERMYAKHGKHAREAMFYCHALALPFFALVGHDIRTHAVIASTTSPYSLLGIELPIQWWYLLATVVAQYFCIRCIYALTAQCTSLTVTLVVTLRKFISLLISIVYFQNPFTALHWVGTICVFGGTLLFADVFNQVAKMIGRGKKKAE